MIISRQLCIVLLYTELFLTVLLIYGYKIDRVKPCAFYFVFGSRYTYSYFLSVIHFSHRSIAQYTKDLPALLVLNREQFYKNFV